MIHTIPYDIRLCMQQPSSDTGRKKSRRRRERHGIRGHPFPFARNLWSLCISPCSVYNNNDKE